MFVLPLGFELFLPTHSSPGLSFLPVLQLVAGNTALQGLGFHLTGLIKNCFCGTHLPALQVLFICRDLSVHMLVWLGVVENSCGIAHIVFRTKRKYHQMPQNAGKT